MSLWPNCVKDNKLLFIMIKFMPKDICAVLAQFSWINSICCV